MRDIAIPSPLLSCGAAPGPVETAPAFASAASSAAAPMPLLPTTEAPELPGPLESERPPDSGTLEAGGRMEAPSPAAALAEARSRFTLLSSLMCEAMILVDARGHVLSSNPQVQRYTGISSDQLVYDYGRRYFASNAQHHTLEREELPLARALCGETVLAEEITLHTGEQELTIHSSAAPLEDSAGRCHGALLVFEDVSRRARAERRHELLHEVSVLVGTRCPSQAEFARIAQQVGEAMGAWTVLALVHEGVADLDFVATYHPDPAFDRQLWSAAREIRVAVGGDPGMGRVAATGKSILNIEPANLQMMPDLDPRVRELFPQLGYESLLIVPLTARARVLGVLMLVSLPQRRRFNQADLEYSLQIVDRIAVALDTAQLVEELRGKEARLSLLARLSRPFATTLDQQQVLRTVAAQLAEGLADWCVIGLRDEVDGHVRPAAVYHRQTRLLGVLQRMLEGLFLEHDEGLARQVVETRRPLVLELITDDVLANLELSPVCLESMGQLEPSSYLCVPLTLRGKFLGYLELACSRSGGRRLDRSHLSLLEELSYRAAYAIQNAQLYEELQGVIRAKDDWLSVASHELKTPLTPLQVQLQLMLRKVRKGDTITPDQLEKCLGQVTRMVGLIDELLDVSNVELGQLELKLEPVKLRELTAAVVAGFQDSTDLHRIFLLDTGGSLVVEADRSRLEQVLVSLLSNAIKYSPEGGDVLIVLSAQEVQHQACALITVQDQGIGIPQAEQHRLFQRYFRGSNVSERNYGGLGLGLWMSHEIITRHHGHMWAESEERRGSRFCVALPLLQDGLSAFQPGLARVLLMGSEIPVLLQASQSLRSGGYSVSLAQSAQEALRLVGSMRPDLAVLDASMPGMDGWTLLRHLRTHSDAGTLPVVMLCPPDSPPPEPDLAEHVVRLETPFTGAQLLATVAQHLPSPPRGESSRAAP